MSAWKSSKPLLLQPAHRISSLSDNTAMSPLEKITINCCHFPWGNHVAETDWELENNQMVKLLNSLGRGAASLPEHPAILGSYFANLHSLVVFFDCSLTEIKAELQHASRSGVNAVGYGRETCCSLLCAIHPHLPLSIGTAIRRKRGTLHIAQTKAIIPSCLPIQSFVWALS